ncbi:bromodomain testis-specific protein isoform X2 [Ricinus communis]|uniref:bromodomain testis-specific protein isoform X2 n=1 Tax=Ricinus communis TaxID=3988 RepID=UPI00201AFA99|nr:bromodomain testis-specific protein isoform X2 [Ricinus communis]
MLMGCRIMKRKRGNKKGKKKGPPLAAKNEPAANVVTLIRDDDSDDDGSDDNNKNYSNSNAGVEYERVMEVDTPSSTGTDQPLNLASIKPDGSIDKTSQGKPVGRVKVKLKTSKVLESQSDTDKSSLQLGLEKQSVVSDKVEDTGNSVSEMKTGFSGNVSKKPGSIKIKSSKVIVSLSAEKSGSAGKAQDESLQQKEPRTPSQESQYSKQELDSALEVIKKVMKMDAAEPFNVPVNPEALGIPDYFDIIDTPMDFGTICSNLETGDKYMNSEAVYKDVQYIWDNCYKYNNKGDYILDLMRRVKKNFMKYWTAAGLFTEQSRGSSGAEGAQGDDVGASSQGHGKSGQPKQKAKKRHGYVSAALKLNIKRRHKSDCLCAICVLKRRRREREENERIANQKLPHELKQEGSSLIESPAGEDSSSNMDESLDPDADADVEGKRLEAKMEDTEQQYSAEKEKHEEVQEDGDEEEEDDEEEDNEIEIQKRAKVETSEQSEFADRSGDEPNQQPQPGLAENAGAAAQINFEKGHLMEQHEDETAAFHRNKNKDSQERQQKAEMFEKFCPHNPMLLSLCQTLFPDNRRSVWSGPHSLVPRQGSAHGNSIGAAIETLMK